MQTRTRIAAIDIGTNSIRCIVVEPAEQGRFRILDDEKGTVRLGEGLSASGAITPMAAERARQTLTRMRKLVDGLKVSALEVVATSAVRSASNGPVLVREWEEILGTPVRVISGEEEAALAAQSALRNFDLGDKRFAVLDIGGGSLELATVQGSHVEAYYSLDLGAVVLTERFFASDPVREQDYKKFRRHVGESLKNCFNGEKVRLPTVIGSGGTVNAIAAMISASHQQPAFSGNHGMRLLRSEIVHLLAMLLRTPLAGRGQIPGLNPDRADIIVAGVGVVDALMEFFDANVLLVNERGIREGMIVQGMRRHGLLSEPATPRSWRESLLAFGRSCQMDEPHARQVAMLALSLFDTLAKPFGLGKRERAMLEGAALLHDIGYYISYHSHHKHSCHLIRHADLYGFTPRERELMAQAARYHRKALPKKKHADYQQLSERDKLTVARLGGILRLADGLDRRRAAMVEELTCQYRDRSLLLTLHGSEDLSVELFGAAGKKDLFEQAFGLKVVFLTPQGE
ncbi:Ppx/GppA phosphatase family protein [Trichlorobacter ammonificans]|uniref:Exopolyphosphatase n=1 Tax=Trichlorobacter ammonificans TaxID=2916410 RepID=A0ABM9D6N3_9BACT|nr:Ppx/GppA phosphatase family protein [Trichlorobacter ammonificans]CAH2030850.1 Exopolyphosphatase [Trichlorobacter ammonificans]